MSGRKTSLGGVVGSAASGCVSGMLGFGLRKVLKALMSTKAVAEGIYVVTAKTGLL